MNILYENLKKVGAIISVYPQKARVFEVLLPTIMMLTGYWIGYDLFLYGYFIPIWTPILILAIVRVVQLIFSDTRYDKKRYLA